MTDSPTIHLFLGALKKESFRTLVESRVRELALPPPYDSLVSKLIGLDGDIKKKDFVSICHTFLNPGEVKILEQLDEVSGELGLKSLEELVGLVSLEKIGHILKRDSSISDKLEKIETILESSRYSSREPSAKLSSNLEVLEEDGLFTFLRYRFSKKKLHLLAAYSGMGKTNISLALAKYTGNLGLDTHYISIADWTESEIRHKIEKCENYPDIWMSILDEASLYDLELELEQTKPDIAVVDSITDITSFYNTSDQFYLELERRAKYLRKLAVKFDVCLITTHQLILLDDEVLPEDLLGGKAHLLKGLDLALGIGGKLGSSTKTVSPLKVRHQPTLDPFKITVDFEGLVVYEKKDT